MNSLHKDLTLSDHLHNLSGTNLRLKCIYCLDRVCSTKLGKFVPSNIVDLEVNYSFIEANVLYSTHIPRLEKHLPSFLIVIFSTGTAPTSCFEMYLHLLLGRYPTYSTILQVPTSWSWYNSNFEKHRFPMLEFLLNTLIVIVCVYRSNTLLSSSQITCTLHAVLILRSVLLTYN